MADYSELRKAIRGGKVLLPGDPSYDEHLRRWSAACEKTAAVLVLPSAPEEVSAAVVFSVETGLPFTACCGGHSSSGTSSTEGMVIDLRLMRSVSVDEASLTVSYDGGCLWKDLDDALVPRGFATVGGVVNHTGVGGLILGGGHGYLTAKHGLTIDNLLSAEIVLADGSIKQISETENSDLFWAIRGAGAQFGIVTRFVSRIHTQGHVWSGMLGFTCDKLAELVTAANEFHDKDNRDGHCLSLGIGYSPDGQSHTLTAFPLYHGSVEDGKQYFSTLLNIGPVIDQTGVMTMANVNELLNPVFEHGIRRLMGSGNVTMPLDAAALRKVADAVWDFCDDKKIGAQSSVAIEFFPTHKLREVSQTATAYANRGGYYDAVTAFGWEDPELDTPIRLFNRSLCKQIRETIGYDYKGDGAVGRYINIEADRVSPEAAYGVNLARLREVKARYDPQNVFNKWHGITPSQVNADH